MGNVHGFFYFYFINEQVLRFLGKRYHQSTTSFLHSLLEPAPGLAFSLELCTCRSFSGAPGPSGPDGTL